MIKARFFKRALAGLALAATMTTAAAAATFNITGGTASVLPSTYNPACNGCTAPSVGDAITVFNGPTGGSIGGGLGVSAGTTLRFTFIGKEASALNALFSIGGATLTNNGGFNTTFTVVQSAAGLLNFLFQTQEAGMWDDINGNGSGNDTLGIVNGGNTQFSGLSLAFSSIFNGGRSVYAFFGDGRGDVDFDDMVVRIDVVPLPATALLMFGALGGLGALRARRRKAAAAA